MSAPGFPYPVLGVVELGSPMVVRMRLWASCFVSVMVVGFHLMFVCANVC